MPAKGDFPQAGGVVAACGRFERAGLSRALLEPFGDEVPRGREELRQGGQRPGAVVAGDRHRAPLGRG